MSGASFLQAAATAAGFIPVAGPVVGAALAVADALGAGKWITDHILGETGGAVAQAVLVAAQAAVGTQDVTAGAVAGLPPDKRAELQTRLAEIAAQREAAVLAGEQAERQAHLDELADRLKDVADARAQTVSLARAGSAVQWAPAIVSFVVLLTFGVVMWAALTRALPTGSETILNMLLGTLAAMATAVVSYWVGSSSGSAQKTELLFRSAPTQTGAVK